LVHQGKVHLASLLYRHRRDCSVNISLCGLRERCAMVTIPRRAMHLAHQSIA